VLQDGVTGPVIAERDELKAKLAAAEAGLRDAHSSLEGAEEERKQLTWRVRRLDEKLLAKDKCAPVLPCFASLVWHLRRAVKFCSSHMYCPDINSELCQSVFMPSRTML
jgi:hypothetical protein